MYAYGKKYIKYNTRHGICVIGYVGTETETKENNLFSLINGANMCQNVG